MTYGTTPAPENFAELQGIRSSLQNDQPKQRPILWVALGVVAIVILLVAAVIQVVTPKKVSIPQTSFVTSNVNSTVPNLKSVRYTGSDPDLPSQFTIFSSQDVLTEQAMISDLSAKYGLLRPNTDANYWTNGGLSLVHDTTLNTYTLTLKDLADESLPVVDPTQAEQVATAFLKETFPETQLKALMDQSSYYLLGLEVDSNISPSKATGVNIPFTPMLATENFPVIYGKANQEMFIVTVDGSNTIRSVMFFPQFQQYSKVDTRAPISIQQALDQIKLGVGSIISASIVENEKVTMSQLTTATFTKVTIEYRQDPVSSLLYPFYRFSGTAVSSNDITADVQVITPAIQTSAQTR